MNEKNDTSKTDVPKETLFQKVHEKKQERSFEKEFKLLEKRISEEEERQQELTNLLETEKQRYTDIENKLRRALADYQNLQVRVEREKKEFVYTAKERVLAEFLPILTNLERAQTAIQNEGLQAIVKQFNDVMVKEGLVSFGNAGEEFDPFRHDCIEVSAGEENKITEVLEKGFQLGDKVIKAAKVKVGKKL